MRKLLLVALAAMLLNLNLRPISAAEPGWSPVIIATGTYRSQIQSKPIEHRPYRPLHFYGNAVRRRHHRGNLLPMPRDLAPVRVFSVFGGGQ
ncbi:MAG: hypothetical protein ACR2NZ_22755 [Rubripirellula sp.]